MTRASKKIISSPTRRKIAPPNPNDYHGYSARWLRDSSAHSNTPAQEILAHHVRLRLDISEFLEQIQEVADLPCHLPEHEKMHAEIMRATDDLKKALSALESALKDNA